MHWWQQDLSKRLQYVVDIVFIGRDFHYEPFVINEIIIHALTPGSWSLIPLIPINALLILVNQWVPDLFLTAYHLRVPYCHRVTPCSRKTHLTRYHSIERLENWTWHKSDIFKMAVRNTMAFVTPIAKVNRNAKILQNPIIKSKISSVFFCEEKQKVGLLACHSLGNTAVSDWWNGLVPKKYIKNGGI